MQAVESGNHLGVLVVPAGSVSTRHLLLWLMFTLVFALCLPLSNAGAGEAEEKQIETAQDEFYRCQVEQVKIIDDAITDVRAVALELTNYCAREYTAMNKIIARYQIDNNNERRMFTVDQDSDALKIDASRPIVEMYRSGSLPDKRPG